VHTRGNRSSPIRVVDFLGPAGVGKSTQIRLLEAKLNGSGYRASSTFIKTGHLFSFLLLRLLARGSAGGDRSTPSIRVLMESRPELFRRLFGTWLAIDMMSVLTKYFLAVWLPVKADFRVLVEEGIPATIADYLYISQKLGLPADASHGAIGLLCAVHKRGAMTAIVYLDADQGTTRSRRIGRGGMYETDAYVREQSRLLPKVANALSGGALLYLETTSRSVEEISSLIEQWVLDRLRGAPAPGHGAEMSITLEPDS